MNKIETFNKKLLEYNRNQNYLYKILQYIMQTMVVLLMLVMTVDRDFMKTNLLKYSNQFMMIGFMIYGRLGPLLMIKEKDKNESVLGRLTYVPINRKKLIKFRRIILIKYLIKVVIVCIVVHIIASSLIMQQVTIWSLISPLSIGLCGWGIGEYIIRI